jgi:hypothetical protein
MKCFADENASLRAQLAAARQAPAPDKRLRAESYSGAGFTSQAVAQNELRACVTRATAYAREFGSRVENDRVSPNYIYFNAGQARVFVACWEKLAFATVTVTGNAPFDDLKTVGDRILDRLENK